MSNYTILIVDYDPTEIELAIDVLQAAGFTVETARDGVEAMEAFLRLEPHLTLIEMMLPKKSGLEVCRDLKMTTHGRESKVVVLGSRFRTRKYRHQALGSYQADDYVEKPLNAENLGELTGRLFPDMALRKQESEPVVEKSAPEPVLEPVAAGHAQKQKAARPDATTDSDIIDRIDSLLDCLGGDPAPKSGSSKPGQGS